MTDADFADDLALTTDTAAEAQDLLLSVELAANSIRLHLNESKTKYIGVNLSDDDATSIRAASGEELEKVDDFVYLGSRIMRTERDFEVRKGKAWGACHQLKIIWMRKEMEIRLFRATVESVLLCGPETLTMSQ